jgi:hypothetical protein
MLIDINYDNGGGKDDGRTGSKYVFSWDKQITV